MSVNVSDEIQTQASIILLPSSKPASGTREKKPNMAGEPMVRKTKMLGTMVAR